MEKTDPFTQLDPTLPHIPVATSPSFHGNVSLEDISGLRNFLNAGCGGGQEPAALTHSLEGDRFVCLVTCQPCGRPVALKERLQGCCPQKMAACREGRKKKKRTKHQVQNNVTNGFGIFHLRRTMKNGCVWHRSHLNIKPGLSGKTTFRTTFQRLLHEKMPQRSAPDSASTGGRPTCLPEALSFTSME
nr:uncharacterized protein LOC115853758 isoform X2 [Globicephala melas]